MFGDNVNVNNMYESQLCIEINGPQHVLFSKQIYLTWVPGGANLNINGRVLYFSFKQNCFVIRDRPIFVIGIHNQLKNCDVITFGTRGSWSENFEKIGKYQQIVFTNNQILGQYKRENPEGEIIGHIKKNGIYKPEAISFDDCKNRFDCIRFKFGGRSAKIWKVS